MVTWLNIVTDLGIIGVGVGAIACWYMKKRTSLEYFLIGGVFWALTVALKLAMNFTITSQFKFQVWMAFAPLVATLVTGLYYGLRAGIFECGIPYLATRYSRLSSRMSLDDMVALGIGFAGTEAIMLGILFLLQNIVELLVYGSQTSPSTSSQPQITTLLILILIFERLFALVTHVSAIVVAVYAAKEKNLWWLAVAVIYTTLVNASILVGDYIFSEMGDYTSIPIELFLIFMTAIGFALLWWMYKKHHSAQTTQTKNPNAT